MKRYFTLLAILLLLYSCEEESSSINPNELVGQWKLTEQYLDPGDGSGTYTPVDSEQVIEFYANGTFRSNGRLCTISQALYEGSTGVYITEDGQLKPDNCTHDAVIGYELKNDLLELTFQCIEGCGQRYQKIK